MRFLRSIERKPVLSPLQLAKGDGDLDRDGGLGKPPEVGFGDWGGADQRPGDWMSRRISVMRAEATCLLGQGKWPPMATRSLLELPLGDLDAGNPVGHGEDAQLGEFEQEICRRRQRSESVAKFAAQCV